MRNAADAVDAFAAAHPQATRLAEVVSLAAYVEHGLLRRARLELVPDIHAAAEADLWFSQLVESRSARGIVFWPDAADSLRSRLARDAERLARAHTVVADAHGDAAPTVRLEEEVTWLALANDTAAETRIEDLLRAAVVTMVEDESRGSSVARWAVRAVRSLPDNARETPAARMLDAGARWRVGGDLPGDATADPIREWLRWLLPAQEPVPVGVRLLEDGVELSRPPHPDAKTVMVPELEPVFVEVVHLGDVRRVTLDPDETVALVLSDLVLSAGGSPSARSQVGVLGAVLEFDPTGTRLAATVDDVAVRVWDVETFEPVAELDRRAPVTALAFMHGGQLAIGADDGAIEVWDLEEQRPSVVLAGSGASITALAVSMEGVLLSVTGTERVEAWDAAEGSQVASIVRDGPVWDVAVGGAAIATAGDDGVYVWSATEDAMGGKQPRRLTTAAATRVAVGPGRSVVAWIDEYGAAWLSRIAPPDPKPSAVASDAVALGFGPAGELLVADRDGLVTQEPGHRDVLRAGRRPLGIALSPDGRRIAAALGPTALELRTATGEVHSVVAERPAPPEPSPHRPARSPELEWLLLENALVVCVDGGGGDGDGSWGPWQDVQRPPTNVELARYLASRFDYPRRDSADLPAVAEYVQLAAGRAVLGKELGEIFAADYEPDGIDAFLARLPSALRARDRSQPFVVLSLSYNDALERAFDRAGEPYDLVWVAPSDRDPAVYFHRPPAESPRRIERPNTYIDLAVDDRPVIVKLLGSVERDTATANMVVTEDDLYDYPAPTAVPVVLREVLFRAPILFLGVDPMDWADRLVLRRVVGLPSRPRWYAAVRDSESPASRYWKSWNVEIVGLSPDEVIEEAEAVLAR